MDNIKLGPFYDRSIFTVAIICALFEESTAVEAIFDQIYDANSFGKASHDTNNYTLGLIGRHHVVLTYLPSMGKVGAARAAVCLGLSFSEVRLSLLVGICGGVPQREGGVEILLGDLIISTGIIQYDFGRFENDRPIRKKDVLSSMSPPHPAILSLLHKIRAGNGQRDMQEKTLEHIEKICALPEFLGWGRPDREKDVLFTPDYIHKHHDLSACADCQSLEGWNCQEARETSCRELGCDMNSKIVRRRHAEHPDGDFTAHDIQIHLGPVASGDSVMRSATTRDRIASDDKVIAFEMEAAGSWNIFPTIVVKGVCDYADSHKNKAWQKFAAVTAASGAKALLSLQPDLSGYRTQDMTPVSPPPMTRSSTMSPQTSIVSQSSVTGVGLPVWSVPFDQPDKFFGRVSELDRVEKSLLSSVSCPKVAIEGLGGMGKTRLALEVACSIRRNCPEYSVFWARCSDTASFERDCRRIAQDLCLPLANELSQDVRVLVKQHLDQGGCGNWLLVLDNADDETLWSRSTTDHTTQSLIDYIPKQRAGAILITTRNHRVAADIAQKEIIKLTQLEPSESTRMFEDLVENPSILADAGKTSKLLDYLAHLPLAIVQATAFVNCNNLDNIESYLEIWNEDFENQIIEVLSEDFSDDIRYQDSQNAVAKTWLISFKHISTHYPLAAQIMYYMACLDPKDIRKSTLPPLDASNLQQVKAFGTLKNYSFIQSHQSKSSEAFFDMHPLVHLATRNYLRQLGLFSEQLRIVTQHVLDLISMNIDSLTTDWFSYLPHAEKLASTRGFLDSTIRIDLQELLSRVYFDNGLYEKALAHRQDVVSELERQASQASGRLILNQASLSETLRLVGRLQEALTMSFKAIEAAGCFLDGKDPLWLQVMKASANAYSDNGYHCPAVYVSSNMLDLVQECNFETREAQVFARMSALHTYSSVNFHAHFWEESKEALLWALAETELLSGYHRIIHTAKIEMDLAWICCLLGEPGDAKRLQNQSRQSLGTRLGRQNQVLSLRSILLTANIYSAEERYAEAEALYRQSLATFEEDGRFHDGEVLRCRDCLANVVQRQGRYEEARDLRFKNIGIAAQMSGVNSLLTLQHVEALAHFYWCWDRPLLAVRMLDGCDKRLRGIEGDTSLTRMHRLKQIWIWETFMRRHKSVIRPLSPDFEVERQLESRMFACGVVGFPIGRIAQY